MTVFSLKLTAVVLMTLDHIGLYFPGAPMVLRLLGRGAYPLFLFCMVQGYAHTRSRRRYLLRLYGMSLFMTALGLFLDTRFPTESGYGNHNIFVPLLLTGLLISAVELCQRDRRKGLQLLAGIGLLQVLYQLLPALLPSPGTSAATPSPAWSPIWPSTSTVSSSLPWAWPCIFSGTAGRPWRRSI